MPFSNYRLKINCIQQPSTSLHVNQHFETSSILPFSILLFLFCSQNQPYLNKMADWSFIGVSKHSQQGTPIDRIATIKVCDIDIHTQFLYKLIVSINCTANHIICQITAIAQFRGPRALYQFYYDTSVFRDGIHGDRLVSGEQKWPFKEFPFFWHSFLLSLRIQWKPKQN